MVNAVLSTNPIFVLLNKIKNHIFPIYPGEYVKFFLLSMLSFFVCINFTLLRNVKETLIITHPDMGINAIPFLRSWFLIPIMFLFVKAYTFLSARYTQFQVCYFIVGFFLLYFLFFVFLLLPFNDFFKLNFFGDQILLLYPSFLHPVGDIVRNWSFSIYYCIAEVWGIVVVLILFWGISNRSTNVEQAKRFYSPMILIANISGIFSAQISLVLSQGNFKHLFFPSLGRWEATLSSLTLCASLVSAAVLLFFFFLDLNLKKQPGYDILAHKKLPPKEEMSMIKIIRYILKNPKFWSLGFMVFAYFFSTGIMEFIWKFYLQKIYPDANDFNDYLNEMTIYISVISTFVALFITSRLLQKFSWTLSAMITPIVLLIPLILLLINNVFYHNYSNFLFLSSFLGACFYCLNRICKFTFFDLTKEIAFVEFSNDEQIKAKAVLDGMVPKFAKTSEAVFLQIFIIFFNGFDFIIPFVLFLILVIHLFWVYLIPNRKKHITGDLCKQRLT